MPFSLKQDNLFSTQDTVLTLANKDNRDIATFQVKGNTTSSLSNLKIEKIIIFQKFNIMLSAFY